MTNEGREFDNEDYTLNKEYKLAKAHFKSDWGQCFTCPEVVHVDGLRRFEDPNDKSKCWYICDFCHQAYWYNNMKNSDIIASLKKYEMTKQYNATKELKDPKRSVKGAITYENVADLCWDLEYRKNWEDYIK